MGDKGRLLSVTFLRRRPRRKIKKNKLLEDIQKARPRSWKKGRDGMNVARNSQRSIISLGWKRKLRVGNRVSRGKERSFFPNLFSTHCFSTFYFSTWLVRWAMQWSTPSSQVLLLPTVTLWPLPKVGS